VIARHTADDVGKQFRIGVSQTVPVHFLTKTVADELMHNRLRIDLSIRLDLIERLDRRQPSHAAPAVATALRVLAFR
jgi:hypothetical protein